MFGIGYFSVRRTPCSCYTCLRKLAFQCDIIQYKYNQDLYKGENKQFDNV